MNRGTFAGQHAWHDVHLCRAARDPRGRDLTPGSLGGASDRFCQASGAGANADGTGQISILFGGADLGRAARWALCSGHGEDASTHRVTNRCAVA